MVTRTGLCFRLPLGTCLGDGKVGKVYSHHLSKDDYGKDGDDKVVDCCTKCHTELHRRLRERNACSLSVAEVRRLSTDSYARRTNRLIYFSETTMPNVELFETIKYNTVTGHVHAYSYFGDRDKHILTYIDV